MIGHDANSETSHGAIARGARLSMLEGGTELFLQSDQGASEKELNSPHARPIGPILARRCGQRFRLGLRTPPYVLRTLSYGVMQTYPYPGRPASGSSSRTAPRTFSASRMCRSRTSRR